MRCRRRRVRIQFLMYFRCVTLSLNNFFFDHAAEDKTIHY
jgi:hypothetical protein